MAPVFDSSAAVPQTDSRTSGKLWSIFQSRYLLFPLIFLGVAARIFLILRSGNGVEGVLGGGSDAPAYVLLGEAILRIPLVDPILCVLAGLYVSPLSRESPAE